jgi:hypothetical protein
LQKAAKDAPLPAATDVGVRLPWKMGVFMEFSAKIIERKRLFNA